MRIRLGELLVSLGLVTKVQVEEALGMQSQFGGKLGTNLVEMGFVSDEKLAEVLSKQLNMPGIIHSDLERIPKSILDLIPKDLVEKHKVVPIKLDKRLTIAICDPQTVPLLDELSFTIGKTIQAVIAPEIWVVAAMERYYRIPREARYIKMDLDAGQKLVEEIETLPPLSSQTTVSLFQNLIARLLSSTTKEEALTGLLDFLLPYYSHTAVYIIKKENLGGWMLRGFPVHVKEFQTVEFSLQAPSHFKDVLGSLQKFSGRLVGKPGDIGFVSLLKMNPQQTVELWPLVFKKKGVGVILGQADENSTKSERQDLVEAAFYKTSLTLEWLALRRMIEQL